MHRTRSYPKLFDAALRLAVDVLRECEREKVVDGQLAWQLSLLASIIHSAKSVRLLLKARLVWDCLLLSRKMHEAAFTIHYLHSNPGYAKKIIRTYALEIDIDRFKFVEAGAARHGLTFDQLLKKRPSFAAVKRDYEEAVKKQEFLKDINSIDRRGRIKHEPGRAPWRSINWQTKMIGLDVDEDTRTLIRFVMHEGDSVAHLRPHHIRALAQRDNDGNIRFSHGRTSFRGLHFNPWAMPVLPLLIASDCIVTDYHLGVAFDKQIKAIMEDVYRHRSKAERVEVKRRNQDGT